MKIYNAAIAGLGFIGAGDQVSGDKLGQNVLDLDGTHFFAYDKNLRINLVCGSSRDLGRRIRFRDKCGARVYEEWKDMLKDERIDIISVATYTPYHEEIVLASAEAGVKIIYCEKPIANTLASAKRMFEKCAASDCSLIINHQRRFNSNYQYAKSLIESGKLGKITSVTTEWASGRLGNVGTHVLDAIFMLSSKQPKAVSGTLDSTKKLDCRGEEFHDPGAWGCIDLGEQVLVSVNAPARSRVPFHIKINCELGYLTTGGVTAEYGYWDSKEKHVIDLQKRNTSMDNAVENIVNYLDGKEALIYGSEALYSLEAIIGFYASYNTGSKWVQLPLSGPSLETFLNSG